MSNKIVVGPFDKGLRTDLLPFNIDNNSFPQLINAYQWRGRVKRKRGTSLLTRLARYFNSSSTSYSSTATITLDGSGNGNLLTGFSLQTNGNIVQGSVSITGVHGTYTDPLMDGTLNPSGSINYATGAIVIAAEAGNAVSAVFRYYPDLPVMGLEDLTLDVNDFPGTLGFDTTYSYNISTSSPYSSYDVSFYKNPTTATYSGYTTKSIVTPLKWNGQDYQQFWTVNYQGALWATNGVTVPFLKTNIGMQYKPIVAVTVISPKKATLQITGHGLTQGDFLFINEVATTTGINFQTGYVTSADPQNPNQVDVTFPNASIATDGTGGIAQYLTRSADPTKDCIRWYDGDPTNGSVTTPALTGNKGWVNFCPPISRLKASIADLPLAQYYLVGAKAIVPFKDRLLFFGPVVQTSAADSQVYLQDTVIYSQNGTPYYTCSYTNVTATVDNPTLAGITFNPILVPSNQTATSPAYFSDAVGFGGFITAGVDQAINTVSPNEDVLIVGFTRLQTRLVYSGNDIVPFNFFSINSELGSTSTFSAINMDSGVLTKGSRGYIVTSQVDCSRFDLLVPDESFQTRLSDNGTERICAQRDFIQEWVYFTYPSNEYDNKFPSRTLFYNYRDKSWAIFNESFTTYGTFRKKTGDTWATIGSIYPTWLSWNAPWNAGSSTLLNPEVIAGNQQGFVFIREDSTTNEANSLYIQSFSSNIITSPSHGLNTGDYITISGCLGTIGSIVNGQIYSVYATTTDTFKINPSIGSGTYLGGGLIKRMYVPFIQSKQFPPAWEMARKTRLSAQKYLLTTTNKGQVQLLIFLSQDEETPVNVGGIVPGMNVVNGTLIYSTTLYTCVESCNLGLTPFNTNLQMRAEINLAGTDASSPQGQIWHRMNTSLIGDTVQIAITLSDTQMRDKTFVPQFSEIELHGFILDISQSQVLA